MPEMATLRKASGDLSLRLFAFVVCIIILSPVMAVGLIGYMFKLLAVSRPRGVAGTAYEPFTARVLMHELGTRRDDAGASLLPHLTLTPSWIWLAIARPVRLAGALSGYTPRMFSYPPSPPASLMSIMGVRTEFFDRTLHDALERVSQVVILGAGWDTRAYGLPAGTDVKVYEVDAPATQREKVAALAAAEIDASHVTFTAVDFEETFWLDALVENGFDRSAATFVLWEGVTMYLSESTVDATLKAVARLGAGSAIAFDYFPREWLTTGTGLYGLLGKYAKLAIKLIYGEAFVNPGLPGERNALQEILAARGLVLTDFDHVAARGKYVLYGFALAEARV